MDVPRVLNTMIRFSGAGALLLGVGFWLGYAPGLAQLHIGLGIALVLSLWALAWIAWRRTARKGLVTFAALMGLASWVLGTTQNQILPGSLHWIVQLTHLAAGGLAIALGNPLAAVAGTRSLSR